MHLEFTQLRENSKKDHSHLQAVKLALLGDSSTQFLHQAIKGYGYHQHLNLHVLEADHNQIDIMVMDPGSDLYRFKPEFVVLFFSAEKLLKKFYGLKAQEKIRFADDQIESISNYCRLISQQLPAKIIFFNFAEINDGIFGNYANKIEPSWLYQVRKINYELMRLGVRVTNLHILDVAALLQTYGQRHAMDRKLYINADMVFNLDFLPVVAGHVTDIVCALKGQIKKCLVVDLDNTLWGGTIGDDGLENIQIGDLGIGKAFSEFQWWLKQLKERGIILAVCSKNDENIAREVFEKHPEMVLRLEDFAAFTVNWENKIDNIKHIQKILNIGLDSMVFLDDNAFEREMVKSALPQITVPSMPTDPADYVDFLAAQNLFETASFTEEDTARTELYRQEAQRAKMQAQFFNVDDFLASLQMKSTIEGFNAFNTPRVAQLTQRSNQFNLRTVRYTEEDIKKIAVSGQHIGLSFNLKDKLGEHGLIGVAILERKNNGFFIDTWIMSCRVLKRGVEQLMLKAMVEAVKKAGLNQLVGEYLPTPKNGLVKNLLADLGFKPSGPLWTLDINHFKDSKLFINHDA